MIGSGNVLRRLARPAEPSTQTPARALRMAAIRAAQSSVHLTVGVLGVAEETGPLDDLLSRLEDGLTIFALDGVEGLVALDSDTVAATVEAQTIGHVSPASPPSRPTTRTDEALVTPLLSAILPEMAGALAGTALSDWLIGASTGRRLPGCREAGLALSDGDYRVVRLTLDLGSGGRQGLLVLLAQVEPDPDAGPAPAPSDAPDIAQRALAAPVPLIATLGRITLPISDAEGLAVGQVLPLAGLTVASVRVMSAGRDIGPARLGQVAGMRAIRIEAPLAPRLGDLPPLDRTDPVLAPSTG